MFSTTSKILLIIFTIDSEGLALNLNNELFKHISFRPRIDNQENCEKLAKLVVDGWDQKTLVQYAIYKLADAYDTDEDLFNCDSNRHKEELKKL